MANNASPSLLLESTFGSFDMGQDVYLVFYMDGNQLICGIYSCLEEFSINWRTFKTDGVVLYHQVAPYNTLEYPCETFDRNKAIYFNTNTQWMYHHPYGISDSSKGYQKYNFLSVYDQDEAVTINTEFTVTLTATSESGYRVFDEMDSMFCRNSIFIFN
ncbi:hypothetical protein CYY_007089 [Polysphondylium violaceum]|uniref:Uncharacterized protein n=1 Tax=Polysphondylium violaceum TaxID=133409 RepID=A0A8J4PSE0_9MYCE|nr:hypothetical protein CYY_007089 [Polysphondylium violaceum]